LQKKNGARTSETVTTNEIRAGSISVRTKNRRSTTLQHLSPFNLVYDDAFKYRTLLSSFSLHFLFDACRHLSAQIAVMGASSTSQQQNLANSADSCVA
jgi:hypothetical protein